MPDAFSVAAFYSGAGGLDLGFERAGYDILLASDIDPVAIQTHRRHSTARCTIAQDIDTLDLAPARGADVVIGGPPCQGFSVAGKMDPHDPRSRHVWTFLEKVSQIKPRAFVMENVKNLYANQRWSDLREDLLTAARLLGYSTRLMLLNAADFGVPQARERMFLIGVRGEVDVPALTPDAHTRHVCVREALALLPRYGHEGNNTYCVAKITAAAKPVMRKSPYAGMMFNGAGRPLDLDRPSTTLAASMGGNRTPIVEQNLLDGDTDSWVRWYHDHLRAGGPPLSFEKPVSPHLRRLTVEEAAVLQGFPVGTKFAGPVSAQFRQIGNSVPPPVAEAVANHLRLLVTHADPSVGVPDLSADQLIDLAQDHRFDADRGSRGELVSEPAAA
ncbi:MAG: DNA cytosine methyltransferase [Aeromicrobium sp.]|uniref:DNA cytosine methyltransferase n=1 Tax=Aeromicrobium sp. TaxID=1871063 RepID=UPI0039E630A5